MFYVLKISDEITSIVGSTAELESVRDAVQCALDKGFGAYVRRGEDGQVQQFTAVNTDVEGEES